MDRDRSFGRLLRRLRKGRDLTQEALAQQAHCAVDTIKKIEAGTRRPSRQLAELFADCLALRGEQRAEFLATARAAIADPPARRHTQLPHQPTPLVGRTTELAALHGLFTLPATRLVTILGPGGMGKTRLAVALAEQLLAAERFGDGVCFVPLASLDGAERIVPALAEALAFPLDGSKQQARSPRQQLLDYLHARRLLLVLDNIEHLLHGSDTDGGGAAELVAMLLNTAPGLAILATSRERLKLREEHIFPLGGLDVRDSQESSSDNAVALFMQRAQRLRPQFAPNGDEQDAVAHICRLVDGMPLAIELAAGWIDTLAPSAIAAEIERGLDLLATELRDVPARHRSVRALFDASYQRLDSGLQSIFARLAIFRGGATFEALQAVTQATLPDLQALIGASLLYYDAERGRYTIHELLRQYAAEKLGERNDGEWTQDQHAAFFCRFVQQHGARLSGANQQAALAALDAERDNLRAAWAWAGYQKRVDLLGQAVDGLGFFYEWRALLEEGERAYRIAGAQLEAQAANDQTIRLLALLRAWQGNFRRLQGDVVGADQLLRQSLTLLERSSPTSDSRGERAFILLQLGLIASEGMLAEARHSFEESLALYQELNRPWEASHALLWLGDLARYHGAFTEARSYFQASLAIRSACGDQRGIAEVLVWDSHAAAEIGQLDEAEALARQSYTLHVELGDPANRAFGLGELGIMLIWVGKYTEACEVLQQSLDLYQELGNHAMYVYAQGWLAVALLGTGQYERARTLSQQAMTQTRELRGVHSGLAFMLHYAGWVALTLGDHQDAEALLRESVVLHRQTGNAGQLGWSLAQLAYTHWLLDDTPRAQAELLEVIETAVKQHAFLPLLLALPAVALILAEEGHKERAVELYALAWRYPLLANAQSSVDSVGRLLDAVTAALPLQAAAAAHARGQALDFWETAAALHAELIGHQWRQDN